MSSKTARYLLCPGEVTSHTDGRRHYIGAVALARLYGVCWDDCLIYEPAPWWPPSFYASEATRHKGLIRLAPRHDGNYSLPTP